LARAADFDLAGALASPSFTPGVRDAPALVELVVGGAEPAAQRAAAALAKLGAQGRAAIVTRLGGGGPVGGDTAELGDGAVARLVGAIGLMARGGDSDALALVLERVHDAHVRVRRAAISALGKIRGDAARTALLARWDAGDIPPDEKRSLVEALGKIGGPDVLTRLEGLDAGGDAELARRHSRAKLMVTRTAGRDVPSSVRTDVALPGVDVVLRCKPGLAGLLVDELGSVGLRAQMTGDSTAVLPRFSGTWSSLHASRLWSHGALRVPLARGDGLEARIEATLGSKTVRGALEALTSGPIRYRLGFPRGHRRSLVWKLADQMSWLVNDPIDTTWDVLVDDERAVLEITPKKAPDPRFAWRVAEVPAASHPTVAAALAWAAGVVPTDRVWDPFVGSGAELIERALRGPVASLTGSDADDAALAAARVNVAAAGMTARLERGDARSFEPGTVDLVITNPPLGSRVHVDAARLLSECLPPSVRWPALGVRLVWITPPTRHTSPAAERAGLRRIRSLPIDLGGVRGQLERWDRS